VNGNAVTEESPDLLAVEEPLEIRLGFPDKTHRAISITMRTPGNDDELAAGFLFTEGIVDSPSQIERIKHCGVKANTSIENTIRVDLSDDTGVELKRLERHFYTTSSCGVCGKSSIEALRTNKNPFELNGDMTIAADVIRDLPQRLRAVQDVFDQTGGLHASALFNGDGGLELVREDVGRHNALDKVIGAKFLAAEVPLSRNVLLVSGRASFELVQKALMAGIPILAAVGAPSSLAVELATECGMTLIGFVRGDSFNVYTGASRVV
jgi:FdhD protein